MTKKRSHPPEADTQLLRPEQFNQPATIETVSEALVISVANMLKIGRAVVKGAALAGLQEVCYEFLLDTGFLEEKKGR